MIITFDCFFDQHRRVVFLNSRSKEKFHRSIFIIIVAFSRVQILFKSNLWSQNRIRSRKSSSRWFLVKPESKLFYSPRCLYFIFFYRSNFMNHCWSWNRCWTKFKAWDGAGFFLTTSRPWSNGLILKCFKLI